MMLFGGLFLSLALFLCVSPSTFSLQATPRSALKSFWLKFVDFWTGRYLVRETKRIFPFAFSKEEPEEIVEEEVAEEEEESVNNKLNNNTADESSSPSPSAPAESSTPSDCIAEKAFERAALHQRNNRHDAGIAAVIS